MNEHSRVENHRMELRTEERIDDSIEISWIENPYGCFPKKVGGNICSKSSLNSIMPEK